MGTLQDLANACAAGFAAMGDLIFARIPGTSTRTSLKANGVECFRTESLDGVNPDFGSPQGWDRVSNDGQPYTNFRYLNDTQNVYQRDIIQCEDGNPSQRGVRLWDLTGVKKYDTIGYDWYQPMDNLGRFQPLGMPGQPYGRTAQIGVVMAENATTTARSGVRYVAMCPTGTLSLPILRYDHGPSQSFVVAGKATSAIGNIVDYPGFGAVTIYMGNTATQAALSLRDVLSTGRGVDYGWSTANNRLYTYAVTANNLAIIASVDPTDGHIRYGTNENLWDLDCLNGKILSTILKNSTTYANDAAAAAGGVAVGQLYRNGSVIQIRIA